MEKTLDPSNNNDSLSTEDLHKVLKIVKNIKYGSVTLFIQDGKIIQIDKNEKIRLK